MRSRAFAIFGDITIHVTVTEALDGDFLFPLEQKSDCGAIRELRALYVNVANASLLSGLRADPTGADVAAEAYKGRLLVSFERMANRMMA